MNWKSTIALLVVAGVAGVWYFMGDAWGPEIGLKPAHPEPAKSVAAGNLDKLSVASLSRIEIAFPSGDPLVIERGVGETEWKMPGNWPLRKPEADELVGILGNLRTRFHALPLPEGEKLGQYGLAPEQKPIVVKLNSGAAALTLTFGEPKLAEGETVFTHAAYVRVNDSAEVLKLGPDIMPVVRRPAETYRRRQLFSDVERVKIAGAAPPASPFGAPPGGDAPVTVTLPDAKTKLITITQQAPHWFSFDLSPLATFGLKRTGPLPGPGVLTKGAEPALPADRLADAWHLAGSPPAPAEPVWLGSFLTAIWQHADLSPAPAEPARLRAFLAAVTDLWVEEFVSPAPSEEKLGFAADGRTITVQRETGGPVTVRFGAVAKTKEREEVISVPAGPPGSPPRKITTKVPVEFRYARIDGNPQVFVVSAEKFADLFVGTSDITDSRVARFEPEEVERVFIATDNGPAGLDLVRTKGDPNAKTEEGKVDRWTIMANTGDAPADTAQVKELISRLSGLRAESPDRRRYPLPGEHPFFRISITAREQRAEGEAPAPQRVYGLAIAYSDTVQKPVPVWIGNQPRVVLVDNRVGPDNPDSWIAAKLFPETFSALLARRGIAYRGKKLIDTVDTSLVAVTVAGGFALKKDGNDWKLTVGKLTSEADPTAANAFADSLTRLTATEFLTATPSPEDLAAFGLAKPKHSITLTFTGGRKHMLDIGNARLGKPEIFARLDGGAVFGLPNGTTEQLATGAIGLLPLKVWALPPEQLKAVEITRSGDNTKDNFSLTKDGANWKLAGPFTAPVPAANAQPLLTALGNLTAIKYHAIAATTDAEFGFDKPYLKVKLTYAEKTPGPIEDISTKTVLIGGLSPEGRFARLDILNAPVFIVPLPFVFAAQTPPLDLLDRALLALDPTRIAKVKVAPEKPEDAFTLAKDDKGKWAAEGIAFAVDPERIARLTTAAAFFPVQKLAAYGDAVKWADFGLEKPEITISITTSGEKPETHTIMLGKPDGMGGRFARVSGKPAVAVIPAIAADSLIRKKFEYADRTLLTFDPTTLVGLTRTVGKDSLELAPGAAVGWDIVKPAKQKADQQFVEELAEALARLRAERVAAFGKKDEVFKQHGLEPAAAVVTVTVGDKAEQKTLRIGNPVEATKPDGDRFVAVESANAEVIVGVLPAVIANKLLVPAVAFRDHTLAKFVDADKAVLERGDRKLTFAKVGVAWKLTGPFAAAAESAELEALVADLGKLRADTWVAEKGKDLKAFGLEKPEAKWTIFDGDKPVLVLLLGKKLADGRVYAVTDKSDLVALLDVPMTARVLAEYRVRKAWDVDAAQVDSVEIAHGAAKFALEKAGPQWVDPAKLTDIIDVRVVNELLGTLGSLKIEQYAVDKDADPKLFGLDKPEFTLTVVMRGGMVKRTLELGSVVGGTDGKQRYARVVDKDRTDVFLLSAADTARLVRDRAMYVLKK